MEHPASHHVRIAYRITLNFRKQQVKALEQVKALDLRSWAFTDLLSNSPKRLLRYFHHAMKVRKKCFIS